MRMLLTIVTVLFMVVAVASLAKAAFVPTNLVLTVIQK
jgi:hypothetical protein